MTVQPLSKPRLPAQPPLQGAAYQDKAVLGPMGQASRRGTAAPIRGRTAPTPARIARHRALVRWSKRLLPVLALMLLASVALWPEISRIEDQGRVSFRRTFGLEPDEIRMTQPHYRGTDERGRPYTLTATDAVQVNPQRIDLTAPKGDVVLENGSWMMVDARRGVFVQHAGQLDLSGDVVLYRDDGVTLRSDSAAIDMKQGAAASNEQTHAEGGFGVLDAQGFALVDKGAVIQFTGPARLVLNAAQGK